MLDGTDGSFVADSVCIEQLRRRGFTTGEPGSIVHRTHGWVFSGDLKAGYVLSTADGRRVVVESVRIEQTRRRVYNLTVAGTGTYFVGRFGTWVHNCGGGGKLDPSDIGLDPKLFKEFDVGFRMDGKTMEIDFKMIEGSMPDFLKALDEGIPAFAKSAGAEEVRLVGTVGSTDSEKLLNFIALISDDFTISESGGRTVIEWVIQ